jgi:hypothetical protein
MVDTVETLTKTDQDQQTVIGFLNQAIQALEAVHAWTQEHYKVHPDPHNLMADLADLKADLQRMMEKHNELAGKIQLAKREAEQKSAEQDPDDPY